MARLRLALAASAALVSTLPAQRARRYEVGAFGAFVRYDKNFNLADRIGGGARFGYLLGSRVELEADVLFHADQTIGGTSATIQPLFGGGSLVLNLLTAVRNSFYVLGGYSRLDFGATAPYRFTDGGVHGAVGDRLYLSDHVAIRVEGRMIYTPETNGVFGSKSATHLVGSVGFSMFELGGAPAVDTDGDGVVDRRDACPATPTGAVVDRRGCPSDEDQDNVYNGIDTCPATPHGALVDATGCPRDTDSDKVLDGLDKCPDTPVGATVDADGCPLDADGDKVPDGVDQCPNTPAGVAVDQNGCPTDADKDGVFDGPDQCPNTPVGATVDATGCPTDSDQDAVFDGIDKCPSTPPGTKVDATGCPLPVEMLVDSDHDGVMDPSDRCPGTPAGTRVDATGCPLPPADTLGDSDHDGVMDQNDRCPGTPPRARVDAIGCVILFRPETPRTPLVLRGVNFATGRSVLTPGSYAVLDVVAASLVANPEIRIEIAGHTDNTGSAALNDRLSQGRAEAVRHYLASKGVSPDRMVARGYGPSRPIAPNLTPAGRARNRRVELRQIIE